MVDSMFTQGYRQIVASVVAMRKQAGLSQRQLAEALGREQNLVARIETGQRRVDIIEILGDSHHFPAPFTPRVPRLSPRFAASPAPRPSL